MVAWLLVKEIPNAEERDRAARMLVKETFQAARRTIQDCPADKLFSAWLYQTALRRAVWHRMEREAEGNRPTDEKLMAAVSELPPELRAVFVLHRLEGMDEPEIARTLNLAVGTVRHASTGPGWNWSNFFKDRDEAKMPTNQPPALLLCCICIAPLAGCAQADAERHEEQAESPVLTAEDARSALIEMVSRIHPNDPWWQLATLKNSPLEKGEGGEVVAGAWTWNPSERWFRLDMGTPADAFWWTYYGKFEVSAEGKWHATITNEQHGHREPKD